MDSHVVEPPGVWSDRLPARLREAGPRIEYAPAGEVRLVDGKYVETPGTGGPDAAWWVFEGNRSQIKRYIASAGVPADEVTNEGITYDYPHQDGTWPRSREEAALQFGRLPQEQVNKIARGNAIKLLGLDLPED